MQRLRSRVLDWPFHWSRKEEMGKCWGRMCFVEVCFRKRRFLPDGLHIPDEARGEVISSKKEF